MKITNIARLIEATLLLKPTQSVTERVNSVIEDTVSGRFEGEYHNENPEKSDLVNELIFNKMNSINRIILNNGD